MVERKLKVTWIAEPAEVLNFFGKGKKQRKFVKAIDEQIRKEVDEEIKEKIKEGEEGFFIRPKGMSKNKFYRYVIRKTKEKQNE
jgi:hypothetical protein